jgi:hypothetical protein
MYPGEGYLTPKLKYRYTMDFSKINVHDNIIRRQNGPVATARGYWPDSRDSIPGTLLQSVETGPGAQPTSYSLGTS